MPAFPVYGKFRRSEALPVHLFASILGKVQARSPVPSSIIASLFLSVLTLSVFALSRDRGPESTVRRFHQALFEGDPIALLRTMVDGDKESGRYLRREVGRALARGVQIQLGRVTTEGRLAYVDVIYVTPGNQTVGAYRFVVKQVDSRWLIDAGATIRLQVQMYGFS